MSDVFFFDTYAFIEVIRGKPSYKRFETVTAITTVFHLAELNYALKKEMDREQADARTDGYWPLIVEVTLEDIKKAMDFKTQKREVSIPDAVGYIVAQRHGAKFLTGDSAFKGLPGVEFVV